MLSVALSLSLFSLTACRAADEEGMMVRESNENERDALKALLSDVLHSYVPEFQGVVEGEQNDKGILLYLPPTLTHTHPSLSHTQNTCFHSYTLNISIFYFLAILIEFLVPLTLAHTDSFCYSSLWS